MCKCVCVNVRVRLGGRDIITVPNAMLLSLSETLAVLLYSHLYEHRRKCTGSAFNFRNTRN